jgi:hypothetical protein
MYDTGVFAGDRRNHFEMERGVSRSLRDPQRRMGFYNRRVVARMGAMMGQRTHPPQKIQNLNFAESFP